MRKTPLLFLAFFLALGTISACFAQNQPLPPPVDIVFTTASAPAAGQELTLTLKVVPKENMYADISCLFPQGVKLVKEEGDSLRPYHEKNKDLKYREIRYRYALSLWRGPMEQGVTKEFSFCVLISDTGRYEFIAHLETSPDNRTKEESFVIELK